MTYKSQALYNVPLIVNTYETLLAVGPSLAPVYVLPCTVLYELSRIISRGQSLENITPSNSASIL